jgi:hypothetical protein
MPPGFDPDIAPCTYRNHSICGDLWNSGIVPLLPMSFKAVIWDQGEADAKKANSSWYKEHFPRMISGWRKYLPAQQDTFHRPIQRAGGTNTSTTLPFVYVELCTEMDSEPSTKRPFEDFWAAQRAALALPSVGFAVTTDIQRATHPPDKQDVASRVALEVRRLAYHQPVVSRGPELVSVSSLSSSKVRLTFSNSSLTSHPGILVANQSACGDGTADSLAVDGLKGSRLNYTIDGPHITVECAGPDALVRINGEKSTCFLYAKLTGGLPAPPVLVACNQSLLQ